MRVWNLSLVIATFCLTILGTFLTRSGVVQSVHAFSDSDIGPLLLGFFGVVFATGIGLIAWRGDRLRSPGGIDSPLSREGAFVLNNLLFATFAFIVLLGTVFPLLYEAFRGQQVTVGSPYFDTMTIPLGLALLTLMAVGPGASVAQDHPRTLARPPDHPGGRRRRGRGRLRRRRTPRASRRLPPSGSARGRRPSNIQQLVISGPCVASPRRPGLAGPRRTGERRHGRPPRRGRDRRGPRRRHLFRHPHRDDPRRRAVRQRSTATRSSSSASATSTPRLGGRRGSGQGRRPWGLPPGGEHHSDRARRRSVLRRSTPASSTTSTSPSTTLPGLPDGPATIGVTIQPLVVWLWVGGAVVISGCALAVIPQTRRRRRRLRTRGDPDVADGGLADDRAGAGVLAGVGAVGGTATGALEVPGAGDAPEESDAGSGEESGDPLDQPVGAPRR